MHWSEAAEWLWRLVELLALSALLSGCYLTVGLDRLPDKAEGGAVGVSYQREIEYERKVESRPVRIATQSSK